MEFGQGKKRRAEAAVKVSPVRKRIRKSKSSEPVQPREGRATRLSRMTGASQLRSRALHLGAQAPKEPAKVDRDQKPRFRQNQQAERMSSRLAAGRTVDICLQLMSFHLLSSFTEVEDRPRLRAAKGLSAKYLRGWVFILDVFQRRGMPMADVAKLQPQEPEEPEGLFVLGNIETVQQVELQDISFRFRPTAVHRGHVQFQFVENVPRNVILQLSEWLGQAQKVAAHRVSEPTTWCAPLAHERKIVSVTPSSAAEHSEFHAGHTTQPRQDRGDVKFLLDLPLPVPMEVRPHRCRTCERSADTAATSYFSPTDTDILQACAGEAKQVRIFRGSRCGLICISVHCLLWMLQTWHDELNMRLSLCEHIFSWQFFHRNIDLRHLYEWLTAQCPHVWSDITSHCRAKATSKKKIGRSLQLQPVEYVGYFAQPRPSCLATDSGATCRSYERALVPFLSHLHQQARAVYGRSAPWHFLRFFSMWCQKLPKSHICIQKQPRQMIMNGQGIRFDGNFDLPTRVATFKDISFRANDGRFIDIFL